MHLQASLGGEAVRHRGSIWLEDEVDRTALAKTARTSHVILATSRPETLEKAKLTNVMRLIKSMHIKGEIALNGVQQSPKRRHGRSLLLYIVFLSLVPCSLKQGWFFGWQKPNTPVRTLNRTTSEKVENPNLVKTADNLNSSKHARHFCRLNETDLVKEQISNMSFVCLQGPSGSGKTTVALRAVSEAQVAGAFPPIRWYIAAEDRIGLVKGLRDLAIELELATNVTKPWVAAKSVLEWLEDDGSVNGWILLLDNVNSFNDIKDLLPKSSRGRVVITLVEPTDLPETQACIQLEPLTMTASVELLKKLSQTNDSSQAEALAKAVKQLPLALRQAAALVAANPSTNSMGNLADKISSAPEKNEDEEDHVYKALWREQEIWLTSWHFLGWRDSASLKLVRSMSLLSHRGVSKKLLEQCMTQNSDLEGSLRELQRLSLVWTDSENRKVYMHQVNHEVIAEGLLESGSGSANIFIDVLQCLQPRKKDSSWQQWWYPASFHRVSDQTLWHIQSVLQKLESPRVKFLPASRAEFDTLNDLRFTAILSSSGYLWHHHGKHNDVQETVRKESMRWKKGTLQHALCTSLLAAVTSDSARRNSFKLHEESLKEMKNLVDKESRKETKQQEQYDFHRTVYRYIQANFLKFLAKADMTNDKNEKNQDQDAQDMAKELESYLQNSTRAGNPLGNPEAHVHSALSRWYQRQQNFTKALDHLENCKTISTEAHQEDNSSLEYFLNNLNQRRAHLLLAQGEGNSIQSPLSWLLKNVLYTLNPNDRKAGEAFNLSKGVKESFEEQFGLTDPILARPWRLMGEARHALRKREDGKVYCQKALDIVDANDVESVEKPLALFCLAKLSRNLGEKEILLRDAENGFKRINGPGNPETVDCCLEGAALKCDQQRFAEGLEKSLQCRKMSRNDTAYNQSHHKTRVHCRNAWLLGLAWVFWLQLAPSLIIFVFLLLLMLVIWARLARERSEIESAAKKSSAKKIAVVIANSEYKSNKIGKFGNLEGPRQDVERVGEVFERLGFQVLRFQNVTREGFNSIGQTLVQQVAGEDSIEAERCYRVCQQNRASRIDAILLEQAAEVFCEHDCLDRSILLVWSCGLIFMGPARAGPRTSQATLQDIRS
eukprot:symbB.v1.2.031893.t2/scaffold3751.1/size50939/2